MGDPFQSALAEFRRLHAVETALPGKTREDDEVLTLATRATNAAFDRLCAIPAPDAAGALAKIDACRKVHDLSHLPVLTSAIDELCTAIGAVAPTVHLLDGEWEMARGGYLAAREVERSYDRDVYTPIYQRTIARGEPFTDDGTEAEMERLSASLSGAEDRVMDIPSPDAAAFAFKYLIAHAEGRGADVWDDMLEAEARRFAPAFPGKEAADG